MTENQQMNGPHPVQQKLQAVPFPWQQLLWTVVGAVLPLALRWLQGILGAPTPNTDQTTNPPT